ncbi:hypothetical protein E1A91_A01G149400v1 [Gossypium mustelinum]|uniref:DUF7745 domain-containing protein n=1 Tax=Gossypium mustelinum TaxID=34275 RepID=A0A5D3AHN2_GOSMU|nr:hypothetical protein E1A91_A01G149400v1 [Gossypium mustelinum]
MDCRRNRENELKGIWQSWEDAKKTHFWDKYGDAAQLLFVKPDDALLKATEYSTLLHYDFRNLLRIYWKLTIDTVKARLKYKNGPCIFWSNIRDAMGKASGDRHLTLFAFVVYGLIVLSKVLGYVSVELANFLFRIEKWVNLTPAVLAETIISPNFFKSKGDGRFLGCAQLLFIWMKSHFRCPYKHFCQVFVPSTRPIEDFLESEWPPNQSTEEWVHNLSTLTHQEIEWRAPWMIRSTILIGCDEVINYSSLMVLSQYEYDQYVPTTTGLNSVEFLV